VEIGMASPSASLCAIIRERFSASRGWAPNASQEIATMLFIVYYVVAITILVLHFTGVLARHNLEWLVLLLAVTVFPAVIYL
jgi:hypothetical protein